MFDSVYRLGGGGGVQLVYYPKKLDQVNNFLDGRSGGSWFRGWPVLKGDTAGMGLDQGAQTDHDLEEKTDLK